MDWSTVIVSTALSAVVGTLVSLAAVSQTTIRQRRAERHDQARQQLKRVLAPLRASLRKYQARMLSSLQREREDQIHGDDYALATEILAAAEQLHPIRRWLVHRRTRRLFGAFIVSTAEIAPMEGDTLGSIAPLLFAQRDPSKVNMSPNDEGIGDLHRALMTEPGSAELRGVERQLRHLAAGW